MKFRELMCATPALLLLSLCIVRGALQHRHPFFLFVAAVVGTGAALCVARSLVTGATPGNRKVPACVRVENPAGYWFNVAGWVFCYGLMLWLSWSIPSLK